ncbi:unnamed protein product [Nippostrongylus brasiliensis]|uniref:PDZ domain-containing protein n=1 Tax=Nippostrongylus brasiliensis TaxID=27835 RepID=A0A0N4XYF0_NIPBR|nr:unnamed protein product [Nippostrongylus brasiliensis]
MKKLFIDRNKSDKISDKSSVQKDVNDIESKTYDCIPQKDSYKDQTMMETLKLPPRKVLDTGTQKSYSVENVNEVKSNVGVLLKTDNSTGFGMKIQGSMNEGIYVKAIVPMGAADQTGNILPDALTLLSYASPYKVKFELERKVETPPPMDGDPSGARIHPLFRSNTLTHIQFNPVSSNRSSQSSIETTIKADDLPKIKEQPPPPPKIETPPPPPKVELPPPPPKIEEKKEEEKKEELKVERPAEKVEEVKLCEPPSADLSTEGLEDTDLSKMESSDYASDNTSEYRESDHEGGGNSAPPEPVEPPPIIQTSVVERVENAELSVKTEVTTTTKPAPHKPEYCKTLPPKAKPAVTRSDVWSRLYTDKRNQLRRTRDTVDPMTKSTTMEAEITSTIPSPQLSPKQIRQPTEFRFGNLDVAHRERLAANQDILDRQTEELRQLGVL